jgi:formylglycine-generating enzyme required for sulfatase activity/rhodanese-related sulfurtransferase/chromosome segregation ATPase
MVALCRVVGNQSSTQWTGEMHAEKKTSLHRKILQELVPLNALSPDRFKEIVEKIVVEEVKSGRYLFRKGDRDNQSIYLLDGKVNLIDGFRKVGGEVESGTDMSRYPISNMQPRAMSARAVKKSIVARIDSGLLDAFLSWDQSSGAEAVDIGADENNDWMTRMLQSEAFMRIPPSIIQSLLMKMKSVEVQAGDTIINQGDEGDYFYTINKGRCAVSCRESGSSEELLLAELEAGDSFGEEALISDAKRNATVTMLTDGILMQLAKTDFVALLHDQLVKPISYEAAVAMVDEGAVWVDVRTQDEYEAGCFEDSVNIPLATLRYEIPELVFNAKYVMCCDTGRRSGTAAFMLSHKGFDVYVLDGGIDGLETGPVEQAGVAGELPDEADEVSRDTAELIAEVVDFDAAVQVAASAAPAADSSGSPATAAESQADIETRQEAAVAELETAIEALRSENASLCEQLDQNRSTEARLTEQFELLRSELGESGEKLAELYAQARADADEKQRLHEEQARLQEDYERRLQALQSEVEAARKQLQDETTAGQQASHARMQQLQQDLEDSRSRVQVLEADLDTATAAREDQLAGHAAALQEQQELIDGLQQALEQAGQEREQLQEQLSASSSEHDDSENSLRAELQAHLARSGKLEEELTTLQTHTSMVAEQLAAATARTEELEVHGVELADHVAALQQALDDSRQQMEHQAAAAAAEKQALERRLDELSSTDQQGGEQLAAAVAEYEAAHQKIQSLEQELEALRSAQREAGTQLQEHAQQAENMAAGRQAAEEALQQLQSELDAERARHGQDAEVLRESIEELRNELRAAHEQADAEKTAHEEQLRCEKAELQEQYEVRLLELQQQQSRQEEALRKAVAESGNWEQELNLQVEENNRLQQEAEKLNDQIGLLTASADEQLQALSSGHDADQARIAGLEQTLAEKDAQLAVLQEQLSGKDADVLAAGQQQEAIQQQLAAVQQQLVEQDERARQVEQENQESIRKAHEDLTRKNDNEKELQLQIERLRKKLEQASQQQQQLSESSQEDVDNLRQELHAERKARAEERAEMAARQRELKEQLIAVASEHETSLNNHSGALEEARDAAREEERIRLQGLLQTQQQTEDQLQKMHAELQQAHAEIARLDQIEKQRRQAGSDLLQEQNSQAEAAITQLESQLKQLTEERDQLLEGQQELREKLNVLRGEVEVARGLMNVDREGHVEDPVQLRRELEETRKNVEVSVRLRAEAEAARDKLVRERDALRELLEGRQDAELPLLVPALDAGDAGGAPAGTQRADAPRARSTRPEVKAGVAAPLTPTAAGGRKRGWIGGLIGVFLVGISAVVFWQLPGVQEVLQQPGGTDSGMQNPAAAEAKSGAATTTPRVAAEAPEAAAGQPEPEAVDSPPVARQAVTKQATPAAGAAADPDRQAAAVPEPAAAPMPALTAGPQFRDRLGNGGKGPLMAGLPGASYLMGSIGNSLNFDEGPRHQVTLPGFAISTHEITFAEYDRFARATGRRLPHDESWGRGNRPVINVSWHDASAYAAWLSKQSGKSYRLPTEAEWEYAIRAGSEDQHWWSNDSADIPANCFDCGSRWDGYQTAPVGSFAANNFGLHDMAGNVQEWTQDCYRAGYADAPVDGSARLTPECTQRAVRGGAYTSPLDSLRSAKRGQYDQETRLDNLGFRVVREN